MFNHLLKLLTAVCLLILSAEGASTASFAEFHQRAKAGEHLNVVFFGASLTWGANATDPQLTSYRARVSRKMTEAYPQAHFTFRDAAIGGTGSQLGVFRLERDVLRHNPDLVFLDFSANDDIYEDTPETLASYESLVRRIITEAHAPVVQMIFPFGWNVQAADFEKMKRRTAHIAISKAYKTTVGDAILLAVERVRSGETTVEKVWPTDFVHPGDAGYELFADAAWTAFQDGVKRELVCAAPEKMRSAETYMKNSRVRLSTLGLLPSGWKCGTPNLTSAYFDMLMSRWLDDEVIASNRVATKSADGKETLAPQEVGRLKVKFRGTMVMLFGEGTIKSAKYRVFIDGKKMAPAAGKGTEFDSASISRPSNGNTHHVQVIAENLDATQDHILEIEPLFLPEQEQELRLESICVAGGDAKVFPFDEVAKTGEISTLQTRPKVVAYLPNWINLEEFSKTIDYTKITHLNLAFENPVDHSGQLSFNKENEIILKQAKAAGVKVLVSIGGGGAADNKELKARYFKLLEEEHRSAFAKSLAEFVLRHGFDGLDVDIEGPSINEDYGAFIEALAMEFKPKGKLLTAALSKGYGGDRVPDAALAHFDFLNIMAYDATGTWDRERAGQHSSFEFAKDQVAYWVDRGLPKSKAVLGVPFYGYGFGDSWRNYGYPFSEIVKDNPDAARTDETGSTIYYNGIPTISKKARFVLDEKLGGVMIWSLNEDARGEHSLLLAIDAVLQPKGQGKSESEDGLRE